MANIFEPWPPMALQSSAAAGYLYVHSSREIHVRSLDTDDRVYIFLFRVCEINLSSTTLIIVGY